MSITIDQIKQLRDATGVSISHCKKALEEAGGDFDAAVDVLRKKGQAKAEARAGREVSQGIVQSYIHGNQKIGVLVKILCETDFVSRNDDFIEFTKDIAMHIAATSPKYLSPEEVTEEDMVKEIEIWKEQLKNEGKPEEIMDKIIEGKKKKYREEHALLTQKFVKNPEVTIEGFVKEMVAKMGENIKVGSFSRFEI